MSPIDALKYMEEPGKSVMIEKVAPCNWVAKADNVEQWSKHLYMNLEEKIVEFVWTSPTSIIIFNQWEHMDWLNYWMNMFYNTNSSDYNIELTPYERQSNITV